MARPETKVSANQVRSIVAKYSNGAGFVALSKEFEYSIPVIRRVLVDAGVKIRKRGRPVVVA